MRAGSALMLAAILFAQPSMGQKPVRPVAAAGGVTFDFTSISERRFASAFDQERNLLTGVSREGKASTSFSRTIPLPSFSGGVWRVSMRYRMRHLKPGVAFFRVQPGPWRPTKIPECGGTWGALSTVTETPPGTKALTLSLEFAPDSEVDFAYKDLSLTDETPRSPLVLKSMPAGNLDGRFAVSAGQCGLFEHYWKLGTAKKVVPRSLRFEVELPNGISFVGANFAANATIKTTVRPDGSSVTSFKCRQGFEPGTTFDTHTALGVVVRAEARPGSGGGKGQLRVKYTNGGERFEVASEPLEFFIVEPVETAKPRRYCNGIMTGHMLKGLDETTRNGMARTLSAAGVTWLVAKGSPEEYALWRSLGIWRITPPAANFCNGYQVGNARLMPPEDRFVAVGVNPKDRRAARIARATCPVSIYGESPFFRTNTVPYIQAYVKGTDGCWSNWEPSMFSRKGCMCLKCCRAFADYIGRPYGEVAASWPKCVMSGGRYFDKAERFRSIEHGKVVKTLDRIVREATGGANGVGFIPGVAWIEMSSWWRPRNYVPEMQAIDYAGALEWMNPWGPYVAWASDNPYVYAKRKPLCHFFAAQDVRRTVAADYPKGSRPKLLALPQGFQCGNWVSQPEHIAMALDSYFFNGWDSAVVYYFPRGYDARYWRAFAEATTRAARFEDDVLNGQRADGQTTVEPLPGVYAQPCRMISGYLPDCRNVSPLQCVTYDHDDARIVAVFNFWQKGEAFFTLKTRGLATGSYVVEREDGCLCAPDSATTGVSARTLETTGIRLSVGAARTRVFRIRPLRPTDESAPRETDADVAARLEAQRPILQRAAAEDAEYEKLNGDIVLDSLPVI